MSVSCSIVGTCLERADLFALLYVMFSCVFVTFSYGVLGQVCYLIVSIPDLCLLPTTSFTLLSELQINTNLESQCLNINVSPLFVFTIYGN